MGGFFPPAAGSKPVFQVLAKPASCWIFWGYFYCRIAKHPTMLPTAWQKLNSSGNWGSELPAAAWAVDKPAMSLVVWQVQLHMWELLGSLDVPQSEKVHPTRTDEVTCEVSCWFAAWQKIYLQIVAANPHWVLPATTFFSNCHLGKFKSFASCDEQD